MKKQYNSPEMKQLAYVTDKNIATQTEGSNQFNDTELDWTTGNQT